MIPSNARLAAMRRLLRASTLVVAIGLLPLTVTSVNASPAQGGAQGRAADDPRQDGLLEILAEMVARGAMEGDVAFGLYRAAERSTMDDLVAAGDVTPEQFDERLGIKMRFAIAEAQLADEVAEGQITAEQARSRLVVMKRQISGRGAGDDARQAYAEATARIRQAIADGELTQEEGRAQLRAIRAELDQARSKRPARITAEQIEQVKKRLDQAVADGKITPEQAAARLEHMRQELIEQTAREEESRRLTGALVERGVPKDKAERVASLSRSIIGEIQREGEDFELDTGTRARLEFIGLDDEQIVVVIESARRLATRSSGRAAETDLEALRRRIEAAVEAGAMTREEADAKYAEARRRLSERETGSR